MQKMQRMMKNVYAVTLFATVVISSLYHILSPSKKRSTEGESKNRSSFVQIVF
jgi:predicted membrane channel-forming protein YqfA (hemolysin III family)